MSEATQEVKKPNGAPPPEPVKHKNLVQKLCEIMATVGRVAKNGRNSFHNYDYVTESDLADALRGELSSRNVFIFPCVKKYLRSPIDIESSRGVRKTQLTEIDVDWTFVDGDSGEERTITVVGVGEDNVDKGFYKAFTGSEKYMLMKCFMVATGDDPEKESKDERKEVKQEQREAAKRVAEQKIAGTFEQSKQIADSKKAGELALFYTFPAEFNGHFALIYGTEEMLKANKEALVHNGTWSNKLNAFKIPADKMDDLKYVFEQLKVPLKQLKAAGA